jgi:hypothetical protein
MKNQQMDLMAFGGLDAFAVKSITSTGKDGITKVVGTKMGLEKRKILAEATGLVGKANKDALDDYIIDQRRQGWIKARSLLASLDESWGLKAGEVKTMKNGEEVIMVRVSRMPVKVITAEQLAKAWKISLEEAQEIIKKHARIASPVVDVDEQREVPAIDNAPADLEALKNETVGTGMSEEELEKLTAPEAKA